MITTFTYDGEEWSWNGFWGFYFQPVSPTRKKERVCRRGSLYNRLRSASGYP